VAQFVQTYTNAETSGDLIVKQFIYSLKGNVFDWYIDLESCSINSWEQLEHEFLNRFYNTHYVFNMIKLTNSRQ
jgi:hypothetical protein